MQYHIPPKLEKQIDAYRRNVKLATGKMITRETAINRLLSQSLDGVEEVKLPTLAEVVKRVERLEQKVSRLGWGKDI